MDDERLVSEALRAEAASVEFTVPPVGLVWWKSELRMRRERAEQAMRPIAIAEKAAVVCVAAAVAALCVWVAPAGQSRAWLAAMAGLAAMAAGAGSALWISRSRK